jgi:hypothetical protein
MKAARINNMTRNIFLGILTTMMIFLFTSCARKMTFSISPVVPAAQGYVKLKKDKNNNYIVKINITNLAEANRLQPSKNTYVIWMVTNEGITKNIGQLKSSKSFLSKKLTASFETVSSFNPAKIFITAEYEANIQYPGNQVVLSTDKL